MEYIEKEVTVGTETVHYVVYQGMQYCRNAKLPEFQKMNIYVPKAYMMKESINGYTDDTAPVFFPNSVGGYRPGPLEEPGENRRHPGHTNTLFEALKHGYVVVSAGIRGRGQENDVGNAPAFIVDYKAAVRFLKFLGNRVPGDKNHIITNGTSAGGALSALIGATGNHPDYEEELRKIGAYETSDDIFAASCYCPITNLDHADIAYEWEFDGVYEFKRKRMNLDEGGRPTFSNEDGPLTQHEIEVSKKLAKLFPEYVNSLHLRNGEEGLILDEEGNGSFKEYIESVVEASAQKALDSGENLSNRDWLRIEDGTVTAMDFTGWVNDITRMKNPPAFDSEILKSPENEVFGMKHFSEYVTNCDEKADARIIKMMNPMYYLDDEKADKAKYYRIRHGECDRDTSLAISAILTLKLREQGIDVDYFSPWDTPHSGDYDLEELFDWIDGLVKTTNM